MNKIYMAGSLFSEAEVNQRLREFDMLQKLNISLGLEYINIFSPIHAPQNDKSKLPTAINFNAPELDSEEKLKLNGIQQGISKEVFISKVNSFQGALSCFYVTEK